MNLREIENRIDRSVDSVLRAGYTIGQHRWGISHLGEKWMSQDKICCPLAAVVICSKLEAPDSMKHNPFFYVIREFGVDVDWINSFNIGFDNLHIKYWRNCDAHALGVKMRYRYAGQSITFNV